MSDMPGVFPTILSHSHADDATRPFWEAAREGRLVGGSPRRPSHPVCGG